MDSRRDQRRRMQTPWWKAVAAGLGALVPLMSIVVDRPLAADGPSTNSNANTLRDGFESATTVLIQEEAEATVRLEVHDRSSQAAHEGKQSERVRFAAGRGTGFYFSYPLPRIEITDALRISLYLKSNHAGMQLSVRVILPGDRDPDTGQPSFVMINGPSYDSTNRWQRLELAELSLALERQVRILRNATRRPIPLERAYIERLVLNVYGGEGDTEVFVDDLTIAPVAPSVLTAARSSQPVTAPRPTPSDAPAKPFEKIRLERNRLSKEGYGWVFSSIDAPGTDLELLKSAGFDLVAIGPGVDAGWVEDAVKRGFLLQARLDARVSAASSVEDSNGKGKMELVPAAKLVEQAVNHPFRDQIAFWELGEHLGAANDPKTRALERDATRAVVAGLRDQPRGTVSPITIADLEGMFVDYARAPRNLSMLGASPLGWGSSQDLLETYQYWTQRRDLTALANPQGLYWTWIEAAAPAFARSAVWGADVPPSWGVPTVQPEQIRLYTYAALAAGFRGLAYRGDAELTRAPGRVNLIETTFLNAEVKLLEAILAAGADPILSLRTYPPDPVSEPVYNTTGKAQRTPTRPEIAPHPTIRASAIQTADRRGWLLLIADYAALSQFQPPQMAVNDLRVTVPGAPASAQAFEISLGDARLLDRERIPGGTRVSLPDFGGTSLVLLTSDLGLVERLRAEIYRVRPRAIQLAIEQAQTQVQWVSDTTSRLNSMGHGIAATSGLIPRANESLRSAQDALAREDYALSWAEARRTSRSLRVLMRTYWDQALKNFSVVTRQSLGNGPEPILHPVGVPPLLSFNMLPQLYVWMNMVRSARFGENLLPAGDFEDPKTLADSGWVTENYLQETLSTTLSSHPGGVDGGRCLRLTSQSKQAAQLDTLTPFVDHPAVAVRTPMVAVETGNLLRIRVYVKVPVGFVPGAGGVIVRDSLGGPTMQFRTTDAIPSWKEVVLYRRAPASGAMSVTLGLAGYGEAQFDRLVIERIEDVGGGPATDRVATRPAAPRAPAVNPVAVPSTTASGTPSTRRD